MEMIQVLVLLGIILIAEASVPDSVPKNHLKQLDIIEAVPYSSTQCHSRVALIHVNDEPTCSGSFVGDGIILSSSQCSLYKSLGDLSVTVFDTFDSDLNRTYAVKASRNIDCPGVSQTKCDLGLLLLDGPFAFRDANKVFQAPQSTDLVSVGDSVTLLAWDSGIYANQAERASAQVSPKLKSFEMEILSAKACIKHFNFPKSDSYDTGDVICAKHVGKQAIPRWYVGGPILFDNTLVGVASLASKLEGRDVLVFSTGLMDEDHQMWLNETIKSIKDNHSENDGSTFYDTSVGDMAVFC